MPPDKEIGTHKARKRGATLARTKAPEQLAHLKVAATDSNAVARCRAEGRGATLGDITEKAGPSAHPPKTRIRDDKQGQDAMLPDKEVGTQKTRKLGAAWANVMENADPSGHPLATRIRDYK
jgi:hypothetical protein